MQINYKFTLAILAIFLLVSLHYGETVSSAGVGVAPAQITMQDRLKGSSFLKSIRLFNSGEQPITFELNATGEIKTWVTMYKTSNLTEPIQNISVYGKEELILQFTIPKDIPNGIYTGTIYAKTTPTKEKPDTTGGIVSLVFPVNLSLSVTGTQILTGDVTNINTNDVEVGQPLIIKVGFLNTGNVIATPIIEVVIIEEEEGVIDDFTYSSTKIDIDSDKLIYVEWNTTNKKTGNYTADVIVSLDGTILTKQNLSFKLLPPGTLIPKGELVNLSYIGQPSKGETLILKAKYQNTGQVNTVAKFKAEIYRNDELIEILESPEEPEEPPTVWVNETYNFTVYLKLKESGAYKIQAYVVLNENNKTAMQTLSFEIAGSLENIIPIGITIAVLIIVIGTLYILMKKGKIKTRDKKKRTSKQPRKKKKSTKNKKKKKSKRSEKKPLFPKLTKLTNKRVRFKRKPSVKK